MSKTVHLCIDVSGVLKTSKCDFDQQFEGVCRHDDGRMMTVAEVRQYFEDENAKGHRVVPVTSKCIGFDYQTGCPGHEDPWDTWDVSEIARVTVIGKMEHSKECIERLQQDGWRIVVSGPYTDREMHPAVDMERFKFVAERELR